MRTRYQVQVIYNADFYPKGDSIIEKAAGKLCDGAGLGFGERDISFDFSDELLAAMTFARICKIRNAKVRLGADWQLSLERIDD